MAMLKQGCAYLQRRPGEGRDPYSTGRSLAKIRRSVHLPPTIDEFRGMVPAFAGTTPGILRGNPYAASSPNT